MSFKCNEGPAFIICDGFFIEQMQKVNVIYDNISIKDNSLDEEIDDM